MVTGATSEAHFRAGRLQEALTELQAEIKKKPGDARLRVFLFQMLAVTVSGSER